MDAHESAATTRSSLGSMDECDRAKHMRGKGMAPVRTAPLRGCHRRIPKATCERRGPGPPGERTTAVEHPATAGSVNLPAAGELPPGETCAVPPALLETRHPITQNPQQTSPFTKGRSTAPQRHRANDPFTLRRGAPLIH